MQDTFEKYLAFFVDINFKLVINLIYIQLDKLLHNHRDRIVYFF